jgi:hypothetical protein
MKSWLRTRRLQSLIDQSLRADIAWRPIKKVLILHEAHQNLAQEPWVLLTEKLLERQVEVVHFGFDGRKEAAKAPPVPGVFTTQDFNWLGFPKEKTLQKIRDQKADLCIDIVADEAHLMTFIGLSLTDVPVAKIGTTSHSYHLQVQPVGHNITAAIDTFIQILTASKNLKQ